MTPKTSPRLILAALFTLLAAGSFAAEGLPFVVPAAAPVPGIIGVGSVKQVFLDARVIHEANKIRKFAGRPQKYARNPVLVADRPWEQGRIEESTIFHY